MSETVATGRTERILGLGFFIGPLAEACEEGRNGALVVAPSGPGLAWDLQHDPAYRAALKAADVVLTDSSYLVLSWWLRTARRIPRQSGLACLRCFLENTGPKPSILWVMPGVEEWQRSAAWLNHVGWPTTNEDAYIAPQYGPGMINDEQLFKKVEMHRPAVVMIAIGGGTQERLAFGLRQQLSYRPGIFCLGAAIAFLSGNQVEIPHWVDRCWLGWLWRIGSNPTRYGRRYGRALPLAALVARHGTELPPLKR